MGRAVSRFNARKHGLAAHYLVVDPEDQPAFGLHLQSFCDGIQPSGPVEEDLVRQIAIDAWRLRRLRNIESGFFDMRLHDLAGTLEANYGDAPTHLRLALVVERDSPTGTLLTLSRYEVRLERSYFRALHELQRIQARRSGQDVPPPAAADLDITISHPPSPPPNSPAPSDLQELPNEPSCNPPHPVTVPACNPFPQTDTALPPTSSLPSPSQPPTTPSKKDEAPPSPPSDEICVHLCSSVVPKLFSTRPPP